MRFQKGHIPWNKGEHPEYMQGENHPMYGTHHVAWNKGKKGLHAAWNKGLKGFNKGHVVTEETRKKITNYFTSNSL